MASSPSAAKWNILGTNDASFNDGTGIADGKIKPNQLIASSSTLNTWVWDSWTPTWTSSGSAPSIGNGTLSGAYIVVGKTCFFRIKFVGGSTTTWGTGSYFINLPVAGHSGIAANDGFTLNGYAEDLSTVAYTVLGTRMDNTSRFYVIIYAPQTTSASNWAQTQPFTWGTGDYWSGTGFYQVA